VKKFSAAKKPNRIGNKKLKTTEFNENYRNSLKQNPVILPINELPF